MDYISRSLSIQCSICYTYYSTNRPIPSPQNMYIFPIPVSKVLKLPVSKHNHIICQLYLNIYNIYMYIYIYNIQVIYSHKEYKNTAEDGIKGQVVLVSPGSHWLEGEGGRAVRDDFIP